MNTVVTPKSELTPLHSTVLVELAGGHFSHDQIASKVRMLGRQDLDHEAVCTMARDRIKWLAHRVAELEAAAGSAIPPGWDIDLIDGEIMVCAPMGAPGMMYTKSTARGLAERLLHALGLQLVMTSRENHAKRAL
ncbi:hypothetical protein [Polaromonas sp.]|uniref:hypothetical protein n=1 Tax=Polaromonas sp. TaxID=1869339 RepID=UPI00352B01F2